MRLVFRVQAFTEGLHILAKKMVVVDGPAEFLQMLIIDFCRHVADKNAYFDF